MPDSIRSLLAEGDRRSIGRADEVAARVQLQPRLAAQLIECLWDEDPRLVMRAADALEKASRAQPSILARYKSELLGLLAEATQKELRWHLAAMIPRLALTAPECLRAAAVFESWLDDASSIVKTSAMQALFDLSRQNASLLPATLDTLRLFARSGTPAMRARGRILLAQIEAPHERPATRRPNPAQPRLQTPLRSKMKSTHAAIDAPLKLEAPRVERGKPMLLAGLRQRFNPATAREIPALWQRFVPHLGGIPGRVDRATWGVVFAMGAGGAFDYLAGVEVAPGSRLPAEFFQLAIPALTYLVFVHPGHVSRLKDAVTEIWTDLLPASGHRPAAGAGGAPGMLERYGAGFNPRTGFGDIELWIPILP